MDDINESIILFPTCYHDKRKIENEAENVAALQANKMEASEKVIT